MGSCVHCGSGKIRVVSTIRPWRYVACKVCGYRWKTLEVVTGPFWLTDCLYELLSDETLLREYPKQIKAAILTIAHYARLDLKP